MHDLCIFLICFCSKIIFDQKTFSLCWDKLDYPGSIVYLSCYNFYHSNLVQHGLTIFLTDLATQINQSKFEANGQSGYVTNVWSCITYDTYTYIYWLFFYVLIDILVLMLWICLYEIMKMVGRYSFLKHAIHLWTELLDWYSRVPTVLTVMSWD